MSPFPDFMMSQEYLDKRDAAQREPAAVAVDPVKDTVDVAELAVAPEASSCGSSRRCDENFWY